VDLLDADGLPTHRFTTGGPLTVRLRYHAAHRVSRPVFGLAIYAGEAQLCGPNTRVDRLPIDAVEGAGEIVYRVETLPLLPGTYTLSAAVYDERELHPFDHHHQVYPFQVASADGVERYGLVELAGTWSGQPSAVSHQRSAFSLQRGADEKLVPYPPPSMPDSQPPKLTAES
jgi:hypothetical protein